MTIVATTKQEQKVRCAAFIPGGIQCHLAMYHIGPCVFEPIKPFSTYID